MKRFSVLLCAVVFLSFCRMLPAETIEVNEKATRLDLREGANHLVFSVRNSSTETVQSDLRVEILDSSGKIVGKTERPQALSPGTNRIMVPLSFWSDQADGEGRDSLWDRLRYTFEFTNAKLAPISGIVAIAEITPQLFELETWNLQYVVGDSVCRVRVRAAHPLTGKPAAGVEVDGKLEFHDERETVLNSHVTTDKIGNAVLAFNIPEDQPADSPELTVTASRAGIERQLTPHIELMYPGDAYITTDKAIYQPGQVLHMRALVISQSKRAKANTSVVVKITTPYPENAVVFRETLQSSRFGIVHADWQIPESQARGDYRISVTPASGDESRYWSANATVTISRYELPNFVVNVKPDKPYYLPGQNAEVEVHGDYLFGKPVTHGHVRVVREDSREWNYREQKWETNEGEEYQGELDASGRFTAHVNLKEAEDDISDDDYRRFNDLHFAAYVTDATTRRTEQRRFDVRVTRYPIHLYYVPNGDQRRDLPLDFYLSAQYADGSPCECDVAIGRQFETSTGSGSEEQSSRLRSVHTNRYGLAHVAGLKWPQPADDASDAELLLEAHDAHGASGKRVESLDLRDDDVIRVSANKALYRDQEPIEVHIESSLKTSALVVEAMSHSKLVDTEVVTLRNGNAWLTIPYSPQFQDDVHISAYDPKGSKSSYGYWRLPFGARTVLYPKKHQLNLSVRLEKTVFRPGEDAHADLRVRGPNGEDLEGALALAVTDEAVDARVRTERDFNSGNNSWWGYSYWSDRENIAGFRRSDLDKVNVNEPVSADLDLLAEALLRDEWSWDFRPSREVSGEMNDVASVFGDEIHSVISPVASALADRFWTDSEYPTDEETLRRLLADAGIKRDEIRDPWGTTYRAHFYTDREMDKMVLISAGPDKIFGTGDDFEVDAASWPYFRPVGAAMDKAAEEYHRRTGGFIRDEATLKSELRKRGVEWSTLKDRWGEPYLLEFGAGARYLTINVMSRGPGKTHPEKRRYYNDGPFVAWTTQQDFFSELEAQVMTALADYYNKTLIFPETESDLEKALSAAGLDLNSEKMRDPWGMPYYPVFEKKSRYSDRVTVQTVSTGQQKQTTPVTALLKTVRLRSSGPNKVKGDGDDFELTQFSVMISEQSAKDVVPQPSHSSIVFAGDTGAIAGAVIDPAGAVVPNVSVELADDQTGMKRTTKTDQVGAFLFADLRPGSYRLRCESPGFKIAQMTDIQVLSRQIVRVTVTLQVGAVSEAVEVTAEAPQLQTSSTEMAAVKALPMLGRNMVQLVTLVPGAVVSPISTPRLREYFPETLFWQPELITDRHGRSHVNFKLADNITSWKLSVLASDAHGQIGSAEKEFTAFQPFFADLDPPPVLTQNDEISLPVVLRNYLGKAQLVKADMKPESWFTLLGPASQQAEVPAGDSKNAIFPFRAIAAVHEGKQRVTAIGADASDAIERKVSVHPDGEEQVITQGQIFSSQAEFTATLPDSTIPKSVHAELKIYPNLMAHVMESIEGSIERPYGCGEQTISSTYPNLLVLRAYKAQGIKGPNAALALRYLQMGYNRLLSYRASDGGFTYWGRGESDVALTAYALQFLNDATEFVAIDPETISRAQQWLVGQQTKEGSWSPDAQFGNKAYAAWRELSTTSYITRVIAETLSGEEKKQAPSTSNVTGHLHTALTWLTAHVQKTDEPYFIANYLLTASALGEQAEAAQAEQRLEALAHEAGGEAYWELQQNTPFYGWGIAGRVETTALVLRALEQDLGPSPGQNDARARTLQLSGLRFLLREKDRYGVWYSGHATVNVLKVLIDLADAPGAMTQGENPAEIKVNGKTVKTLIIPAGKQIVTPITIDLSEFISQGENHVELTGAAEAARSSAQLVASYYVPWNAAAATAKVGSESNEKPGDSDILRLAVHYDKIEANIGDEIHCQVEVERIGFRGYGMMLAEIGLPPAADVDRESLDKAIANAGWSLDHYDILPDRLVAYVWPRYRGGATRFDFSFRPRMGEVAQTALSTLYDYYNPEAHAVVAPTRFTVH